MLLKLRDECLEPRQLVKYVESDFTSLRYFSDSIKKAFVDDADDSGVGESSDSASATFPVVLFFACIYWIRERMARRTLLEIFQHIRVNRYPPLLPGSSILTQSEEDFAIDMINACGCPAGMSVKELKKKIISVINSAGMEAEISAGREALSNATPSCSLSSTSVAFFVSHYLGKGDALFPDADTAVSSFFAIVGVFVQLFPGKFSLNHLLDRMRKVELIREMILRTVSTSAAPGRIVSSRNMFSSSLQSFSNSCKSQPLDNTVGFSPSARLLQDPPAP